MSNQKKRKGFACPRCGGGTFGSSQLADGSLERICHGWRTDAQFGAVSCNFIWHQRDDAKYFDAETVAGWAQERTRAIGAVSL